mmetsp:Transcript_33672/g.106431  ORF Transcript_33672/g.106431 Transcript_33672/m.106431 type:complete len:165 (+) Transcript_33672:626-1120(+)
MLGTGEGLSQAESPRQPPPARASSQLSQSQLSQSSMPPPASPARSQSQRALLSPSALLPSSQGSADWEPVSLARQLEHIERLSRGGKWNPRGERILREVRNRGSVEVRLRKGAADSTDIGVGVGAPGAGEEGGVHVLLEVCPFCQRIVLGDRMRQHFDKMKHEW